MMAQMQELVRNSQGTNGQVAEALQKAKAASKAAEAETKAAQERLEQEQRKIKHKQVVESAALKSKGNKAQFEHSEGELATLEEIEVALEANTGETLKRKITALIASRGESVAQRQKLIRAADQYGWESVDQLEKCEFLTEEEDKRIKKAVKEKESEKATKKRTWKTPMWKRGAGGFPGKADLANGKGYSEASSKTYYEKGKGPCFNCQKVGHRAAECPNK